MRVTHPLGLMGINTLTLSWYFQRFCSGSWDPASGSICVAHSPSKSMALWIYNHKTITSFFFYRNASNSVGFKTLPRESFFAYLYKECYVKNNYSYLYSRHQHNKHMHNASKQVRYIYTCARLHSDAFTQEHTMHMYAFMGTWINIHKYTHLHTLDHSYTQKLTEYRYHLNICHGKIKRQMT